MFIFLQNTSHETCFLAYLLQSVFVIFVTMTGKYIKATFNLPIDSLFTYRIPEELEGQVQIGTRVLVPFGKRNITGIVMEFSDATNFRNTKPIIKLLDTEPLIDSEMIEFCRWISKYYYCPIGEVIFSAIPKSILVESKELYSVNTYFEPGKNKLTGLQNKILSALKPKPLSIKQLGKKLYNKNIRDTVKKLVNFGALKISHVTSPQGMKPKTESYVLFELLDDFTGFSGQMLEQFLHENKIRSQKQADVLRYLVNKKIREISVKNLRKETGTSVSPVRLLAIKELIKLEEREIPRDVEYEFAEEEKIVELNKEQKEVLNEINFAAERNEFKTFLLFGVTGSGKTQVYIEAIKEVIFRGKTAIVLVPEISLTPQLIHRFNTYFEGMIGVIHSRLSEGQRFDVFRRIISGEIRIVIGARSALFAPLKNIGIIVVDEEHDHSYKQEEKNPKYNARDSAIMRAKLNNAVTVLGSATPSLESFYNARQGKYALLELRSRALQTKQPVVEIVDMLEEMKPSSKYQKRETPETRFLSSRLISYIDSALEQKQSIILLQNRRGYSAYLECQDCGFVKKCSNCDITLIYHKTKEQLRCHYCGHTEKLPDKCEVCGSENILLKGTGTEKVEEEIKRLFPKARLKRMDADTVRYKDAHRKILKSFHDREFDVLVGTQMISKGLDFPNVNLVGVISADIGLLNADFRSQERTFQLLMQVSGRSGRKSDYGRVVIQTMHSDNYIFPLIAGHDYISFYDREMQFRRNFNYPPFSRMTLIEVSGTSITKTSSLVSKIYLHLSRYSTSKNIEIMKPAPALIFKLKNIFRYHIIIKSLRQENATDNAQIKGVEQIIGELRRFLSHIELTSNQSVSIEADPLSFY
jgi:primosomal protein N' (replication factor Y)